MFIVQLEHAILYPEYINRKTSTASCMRWEHNHLYCVAMRTSHTHHCCFARSSNKVKGFFLCQPESPVAAFPFCRRQAHVRGVTRWEAVILNYECTIGGVFPV